MSNIKWTQQAVFIYTRYMCVIIFKEEVIRLRESV